MIPCKMGTYSDVFMAQKNTLYNWFNFCVGSHFNEWGTLTFAMLSKIYHAWLKQMIQINGAFHEK